MDIVVPKYWNTFVLSSSCIVLGIVFGAMLDGFLIFPGTFLGFIQQWQTLLGAILALIGLYVAYGNVSRQISMQRTAATLTLMSREEDRIEKYLTGLDETSSWLFNFVIYFAMHEGEVASERGILSSWKAAYGFETFGVQIKERLEKLLPATDQNTRHRIFLIVNSAFFTFRSLAHSTDPMPGGPVVIGFDRGDADRLVLKSYHEQLRQILKEVDEKKNKYERWLPVIRDRIEKFFEDGLK